MVLTHPVWSVQHRPLSTLTPVPMRRTPSISQSRKRQLSNLRSLRTQRSSRSREHRLNKKRRERPPSMRPRWQREELSIRYSWSYREIRRD